MSIFLWLVFRGVAAPVPTIDTPVRTGVSSPGDVAVVVGSESYAFVPDVPFAHRDAESVRQWMLYTRGIPAERVELLLDASREQILSAVDRAVATVAPDSTVWFYFAGHGAASPADGARLILSVDVMPDPTVFAARGIGLDELEMALDGVEHRMLWLDTCYAGAARGDAPLLPGARFAVPTWATRDAAGATVWSAASAGQISQGYDVARHGLFTYFSVGALRGWADGELDGSPDGQVTAGEAQAYVQRHLATLGAHGQTPHLDTEDPDRILASGSLEVDPRAVDPTASSVPTVVSAGPNATGTDKAREDLDAIAAAQEHRLRTEADRQAAIDAVVDPLREEAAAAWERTQAIVAAGGPEARPALQAFVAAYADASVVVDGQTLPVAIAAVSAAQRELFRTDPEAAAHRAKRQRRKDRLLSTGVLAGLGGAALGGVAWGTGTLYRNTPTTAGPLDGLYYTNQAAGWTGIGLGVLSAGFLVAGQF